MRVVHTTTGSVAASALLAVVVIAQANNQDDVIAAGRDVYRNACASCHGDAATGYGPASWVLRRRPPDLTQFTDRTTPFPRDRIRNIVTGHIRPVPGATPSEMPIWRASLDADSPRAPGVRQIDALLAYLESAQLRPFGPYTGPSPETSAAGAAPLYKLHCAGCHGADGRGSLPSTYVLGLLPPDLTTLRLRRNGFDPRVVRELIARADHDQRNAGMPSWYDTFMNEGWSAAMSNANLTALVSYLESIQRD